MRSVTASGHARKHDHALARTLRIAAVILGTLGSAGPARAQLGFGTGFTYQGSLADGSNPANGNFDFEFALYDAESDPSSQIGSTVSRDVNSVGTVAVVQGVFTVSLDFGAAAFTGGARFLEIRVRPEDPADTAPLTTLAPRVPVNPAPYAIYAAKAADAEKLGGAEPTDFVAVAGDTMTGALTISGPTGDGALALPAGAINSSEIADEPGASMLSTGTEFILSGSMSFVKVVQIPSAGFLFLVATGEFAAPPAPGATLELKVDGVSVVSDTISSPATDVPFHIMTLAPITAGSHLTELSVTASGGILAAGARMVTIFLPTGY